MLHRALVVAGLLAIGCSKQSWQGRPRHVGIVRPVGKVSLKKRPLDEPSGLYALAFDVVGRCEDCTEDEWVDLTVQPPATRSSYVGRAVKEVVHDHWAAEVFVGDSRGNLLAIGDRLDIEATVREENDLIVVEGRAPVTEPPNRGHVSTSVVVSRVP